MYIALISIELQEEGILFPLENVADYIITGKVVHRDGNTFLVKMPFFMKEMVNSFCFTLSRCKEVKEVKEIDR